MNKPKPLPFKAKLLSQPKSIDLMTRTFGSHIENAEKLFPKSSEEETKSS